MKLYFYAIQMVFMLRQHILVIEFRHATKSLKIYSRPPYRPTLGVEVGT